MLTRRVLQLNTWDGKGGAAKVAWTLKQQLNAREGWSSRMLVGLRCLDDPEISTIDEALTPEAAQAPSPNDLLDHAIASSAALPEREEVRAADLLHLHNLHGGYFNPLALPALARTRPTLWTLHDMQALTGHCAHAFECERWTTGCAPCPHLEIEPRLGSDTAAELWRAKRESYRAAPLTLVTPSRWLRRLVERSILGEKRCEVIENGIDTSVFRPRSRQRARELLGLPADATVAIFTANGGLDSPWRDGRCLREAIQHRPDVLFLSVGSSGAVALPNARTIPYVRDPRLLAHLYSAGDLFLFPSLADNCPLVVLESLACGLPVLAYATGGIPELVEEGRTGALTPTGECDGFLRALDELLANRARLAELGRAAPVAARRFSVSAMTDRYVALYEEVLAEAQQGPTVFARRPPPRVSIVTPNFNGARYLEACLDSILGQGYPALEAIVIDGGSSDGSRAIIERHARHLAYWCCEPDGGMYHAIAKGLARASGSILGWLNSDDMLHRGALALLAELLGEGSPVEWLMGTPTIWDREGRAVMVNPAETWSRARVLSFDYQWIQQESTFWTRDLWTRAGGRVSTELALAGDLELWLRFFRHASLHTVGSLVGGFRRHGAQKTTSSMAAYLAEAEALLEGEIARFLQAPEPLPDRPPLIRFDFANLRYPPAVAPACPDAASAAALAEAGVRLAREGKLHAALEELLRLLALRPSEPELYATIATLYERLGRARCAGVAAERARELGEHRRRPLPDAAGPTPAPQPTARATPSAPRAPLTPAAFARYTYSRRTQLAELLGAERWTPDSSLKVYQDLLVETFIRDNLPPGARLLEVGGGESRVIAALKDDYECWNLDRLEGYGGGPTAVDDRGFRLVRSYLGERSAELPDHYFDLVFSISVLEHVPESAESFHALCDDLDRLLRPGGFSLHCFDVILRGAGGWTNRLLPYLFSRYPTANPYQPLEAIAGDDDLLCMSEAAYDRCWRPVTERPYAEHGRPLSCNILWRHAEPRVTAIVSTYNSERFLAGCLDDLEQQTLARAGELEIVVIDSGSTEREGELVRAYQQRFDNIRYLRTERESVYAAWNRAIGLARGRYLTNANTDDRHREDALEVLAQALDDHPDVALAYARFRGVREVDGRREEYYVSPSLPYSFPDLLSGRCLIGCQPMWRRALHDEVGLFDPCFISSGDTELWLRIAQRHELLFVDEILGEFLERPDSICHENDRARSCFETSLTHRCYRHLFRRCREVGREGLSASTASGLDRWYGLNLLRRWHAERFAGLRDDPVRRVVDRRRGEPPELTVVIAGAGRRAQLLETLAALRRQTEPGFEVIVVDGTSGAEPLPGEHEPDCQLLLGEDLGPALSWNLGARAARTRFVAFLDDDGLPEPDLVAALLAGLREGSAGVCGRMLGRNEERRLHPGPRLPGRCDAPGASAFVRELFLELGGFNPQLLCHEGLDLAFRLWARRRTILACPEAVVRRDPLAENDPRYLDAALRSEILAQGFEREGFHVFVEAMRLIHEGEPESAPAYEMLIEAAELLEPHALPEAIRLLERAVALVPRAIRGAFLLGSGYARLGRNEEAVPLLERARALLAEEALRGAMPSAVVAAGTVAVASRLGPCLMELGRLAEVGALYAGVLADPAACLSEDQRLSMTRVMRMLGSRPPGAGGRGVSEQCTSSPATA